MRNLYSDNLDDISSYMEEMWQEDQEQKNDLVDQWRINVQFANSVQNLNAMRPGATVSIHNGNQYPDLGGRNKEKLYITNEIAPVIRTLVSYLTRAKPSVDVFSNDVGDDVGKKKAKIAKAVLDAKYDLDNEYQNSRLSAFWALTLGTIFRKDYWDSGRGQRVSVPRFDELGNEVLNPETGEVELQQMRAGDNAVAIVTPFNMSFDWSCTDFEDLPWIQEAYLMPVEWARKVFVGEQFIGDAGKISDSSAAIGNSSSLKTFESLKYASQINYNSRFALSQKDKVLVRELYCRPTDTHPEGRLLIKVGDKIFFDGPSPYFMPYEPVAWHPYTPFVYQPFIGRLLGRSLIEDVLGIQMRVNKLNGIFVQNSESVGIPHILTVENQIKRGTVRGDGYTITSYRHIPGAPQPTPWLGVPLPPQFFTEKNAIIDQFVRIVGTNFAMQGQAPSGVSAATAISMLLDNANSQQSDTVMSWERYHEQGFTKKIRLIRKFAAIPNESLTNYLRVYARDALVGDLQAFTRDDLSDGIYVKLESGSMIPKQETAKRELYKELIGLGMFPAIGEDSPRGIKIRKEILNRFGEKPFQDEQNIDLEKAEWENSQMKSGLEPSFWEKDNHELHILVLEMEMKKPDFIERASDEIKARYQAHYQEHEAALQQEQQEQMMQQAQQQGMGTPNAPQGAGGPPQGPGVPQGAPPPQGPPPPPPMMGPDMGDAQQEMPQEQLAA